MLNLKKIILVTFFNKLCYIINQLSLLIQKFTTMAGGKETPRQKMIGMMYLVLTALLALNVSKQILKGFVTVDENIEKSKLILK